MQCPSCAHFVPKNACFCPQCGAFVGQVQPQPQQEPQPQQPSQPQEPQQPFGAGPSAQPQPQAPFAAQPNPASQSYPQSCIASAWQDVKASPGWLGRTALLGIIQCVPILNFFSLGYALNWSREVPYGGKTPMPQRIFSGSNFEIGFYALVIVLAFSLAAGLGVSVLGIVPLLGGLAGVALTVGLTAMAYLCSVRMAMKQRIGEGFQLKQVWAAIMRNPGSFLAAALLPVVVAGALVACVMTAGAIVSMISAIPFAFLSSDIATLLLALPALVGCLALYVACCVIAMAATLVTDRALAHWVGRYASEWV